ncbi:MAG TPA: SMP-30/gluconolactonase/LRE family protein [Pyrinomonadaceae bacterium]|jgi:sugar lactone lactonase YvrE|nr:SMP-30/gluconolactonase/LRE family protein [Pyrinomonadaceae bacterium]
MKHSGIFSKSLSFFALLATLALPFANAFAVGNQTRPLGDSNIFARVPAPGFPEGIAINGDRVYVSGPATFGNFQPSKVLAYDINTGALVQEYPIQNQNFTQQHALSACAFGKKDMLYVVDTQQGIIRFDVDGVNNPQQVYATPVPDLPTCSSVAAGTPCSPTAIDQTPLPNDIVFDKDGNLYLSDSMQATIWRIPAGGGQPQIWFQSAAFDTPFGPNGLRVDPTGEKLYIAVTFGFFGDGYIYTLPLVSQPAASSLAVFHQYNAGEGPDGLAFGKSNKLYVACAGSNQISVLRPDGTEEARYSGPAQNPSNPAQPLPWANPANIAFNDKTRSLLVTNHAIFFPNPTDFAAVFDVFVDDKADHLARPNIR